MRCCCFDRRLSSHLPLLSVPARSFLTQTRPLGIFDHEPAPHSRAEDLITFSLTQTLKIHKAICATGRKERAIDIMPDNKGVGWRKRKSKPKELQPLKLGLDHLVATDDASDRRRHHGWRKTIQGSRPSTPAMAPPATPTVEETEDALSERTEPSTPRRDSKPKLIRYTSLFTSFSSTPKGPEFSEPWGEEPLPFEPYTDPKLAIASIRAHMVSFSMKPIPPEHNNSLFRIFEDYHKRRDEIDRLQVVLKELSERQLQSETTWANYERQYADEIRRLELLIAQGVTGVAGYSLFVSTLSLVLTTS